MIRPKERKKIVASLLEALNVETDHSLYEGYLKDWKDLQTSPVTFKGEDAIFRVGFGKKFSDAIKKEKFLYCQTKIKKYMPELLQSGSGKSYAWLLYKKLNGTLAGNVYQYDQKINVDLVVESILDIQKRSMEFTHSQEILKIDPESWQKLIQTIVSKNSELAQKDIIQEIINSIDPFSSNYSVLVHGDLHPANIILINRNVKIIDWEGAKIGSPAFDLSFIWLRSPSSYESTILDKMFQFYPNIENEARNIFMINALRDIFEWSLVVENRNKLLDIKNMINNSRVDEIEENSLKRLERIYRHGLKDF